MTRRTYNRRRVFAALACLIAVVSWYAPLAGAAWASHAMACCTNGYCNIPKHHHQKAPVHSATAQQCGHTHEMMDCSMSCCQDPDKVAVSSTAFVMPPAAYTSSAVTVTRSSARVYPVETLRTIEPLSPPPRTDYAAL